MTITTRNAMNEDKAFLWRLKVESMRAYVTTVYGWNDSDQQRFFIKGFRPKSLQIIQADGQDVGMYELQERDDDWYLARIEVLPPLQKKGIGTAVIHQVIQRAYQTRKPLKLQVFKVNPAQILYQRLGFLKIGETETHIQMELPITAMQ